MAKVAQLRGKARKRPLFIIENIQEDQASAFLSLSEDGPRSKLMRTEEHHCSFEEKLKEAQMQNALLQARIKSLEKEIEDLKRRDLPLPRTQKASLARFLAVADHKDSSRIWLRRVFTNNTAKCLVYNFANKSSHNSLEIMKKTASILREREFSDTHISEDIRNAITKTHQDAMEGDVKWGIPYENESVFFFLCISVLKSILHFSENGLKTWRKINVIIQMDVPSSETVLDMQRFLGYSVDSFPKDEYERLQQKSGFPRDHFNDVAEYKEWLDSVYLHAWIKTLKGVSDTLNKETVVEFLNMAGFMNIDMISLIKMILIHLTEV